MSIVTKTGDKGTTGLMYGHRVMKCDPRVEACGAVDELNSALGIVRAAGNPGVNDRLLPIQKELVTVMGEIGVLPQDLDRYAKDGYPLVTSGMTSGLEKSIRELEAVVVFPKDWATPGSNPAAAALDLARAICRRAERRICMLQSEGQLQNGEIIVYLNRLADLLWLMARDAESGRSAPVSGAAR
ncbi:MAG TPA: cob(I)yrinic acid a,c-diamide adenosyltransferase [Verrucomicrobiae bacterium]|nr:cob(I)yrinic acid a,c-diamide adenosyltransferase [Verrucomicrobiae bacterium]